MKRHLKRRILANIISLPECYNDLAHELNHKFGNTIVLGHFTEYGPVPIYICEFNQDGEGDFYVHFVVKSSDGAFIEKVSKNIYGKQLESFEPLHIEYGNYFYLPGKITYIGRNFEKTYKKSASFQHLANIHPYEDHIASPEDTVLGLMEGGALTEPVNMLDCNHKDLSKYRLSNYEGLIGNIKVPFGFSYVGIELEFEGVNANKDSFSSYNNTYRGAFSLIEDHSLKVNGVEFVSPPIRAKYVEMELKRLFHAFNPIVSPRCSIHVHLNVRDMKYHEIVKLMMIYCLYEREIYRISGDRWFNNFCVPLRHNPRAVIHILSGENPRNCWGKYSGLNLLPLINLNSSNLAKGTIEFRMHEGTVNVERIIRFVSLITTLKHLARTKHPLDDHSKRLFGYRVEQDPMWKILFSKVNEIQPWLKGAS